ncbi:NADP-dependent oxidoreductase [Vibrio salinus]|uniref:NADP-dependent oxidoreductase n=1 Tax=Vibrio salinus TaxID=2899784 RepID=UPI001E4AECD8|nr:NADP-dependent oxidoreductase [Vibrio salinus]MCE0495084.1 NADP-dependent oxidoreductase [Vibrio salinus]
MRAVLLKQFGGTENLKLESVPEPLLSPDEVLVNVISAGINPIDIKTRAGQGACNHTPVTTPEILGWDLSGIVVKCGEKVTRWKPGDEVFGSVGFPGLGRTHAEYAAVKAGHLAPKPQNVSHDECAAAAMTGLTAWQALTRHCHPEKGSKILIHGASGGVGHMAAQIALNLGLQVTGTASPEKCAFVHSLGIRDCINYKRVCWNTYENHFDFILNTVSNEVTRKSFRLLKPNGVLVSILPPDEETQKITRTSEAACHFVLMQSNGQDMAQIGKLLEEGKIHPHIAKTLPLSNTAQAHQIMEAHHCIGKIVLKP